MIYQHDMAVKHDPDEGLYGDCLRASIATLFQTPYVEDIPHFLAEGEDATGPHWFTTLEKWFSERGVRVLFGGVDAMEHNPNVRSVAAGPSPRNDVPHAVVWEGGKVVWDPHLSRMGLADAPQQFFIFAISDATLYDAWRDSVRCG